MYKKLSILSFILVGIILTGASCVTSDTKTSGPTGMFRSVDSAENWQQIVALPTAKGVSSIANVNIFRIYEDPSDPNAIYLGSRGQGVFYSYDNGDTWRNASALNGKFIYAMAVDPKDKCNIFVSDGPHIYKTTDCSRTWTLVYTEERPDQRFVSLSMDPHRADVIYGAELGGDILKSVDSGRSWKVMKRFGFYLQYMTVDPKIKDRVYLGSYRNGLFRSDDGGVEWRDMSKSLEGFSDSKVFSRLILNPAQKDSIFWISKYGVLRSDDAGVTWNEIKLITPPGSVNIYSFAINPKNQKEMYYTATILGDNNTHVRSTFYKTIDGGNSWVTKKLPTTTIPTALRIHPDKPNVLFMGFSNLEKQLATTL